MEKNLPVPNLQKALDLFIEVIFIAILIASPVMLGSVNEFPRLLMSLGAFFILLLWLARSILKGSFELVIFNFNKVVILFFIFLMVQYLFIDFFVQNTNIGMIYRVKMKRELIQLASYFILFFVGLNCFNLKSVNRLLLLILGLGFGFSVIGIIQRLSGAQKIFWLIPIDGPSAFFGFSRNRDHFASYVNMAVFVAIGFAFSYFPVLRNEIKNAGRRGLVHGITLFFEKGIWFYFFGLAIMTCAVFYSLSRGGVIAFLISMVFFMICVLKKKVAKRGYLAVAVVLLMLTAALFWMNAPEMIVDRFKNPGGAFASGTKLLDKNIYSRKGMTDNTVDLIKAYPAFGVGYGALEFIYNKRYEPNTPRHYYIDYVHNDFLQLIAETGLAGFLIFFMAACLYVIALLKFLGKRHNPYSVGVGCGIMAALFSMCVHSFFDFNFHITSNAILFFTLAGMGLIVVSSKTYGGGQESLLHRRSIPLENRYVKIIALFAAVVLFVLISSGLVNKYLAYRISMDKNVSVVKLKRAVKLDPANDKYRFLLAKAFFEKSDMKERRRDAGARLAAVEMEKAIELNPWNRYYPVYLEWLKKFI